MIGAKLSHYTILEPLGAGGMGVVYLARDDRLERKVAIKVLPTGALADDSARKQFRKEALALSKLNHPNIATIHDFDSHDGTDFLVMEFVEGRTLSDRVADGPLPEAEVRRLGEQLAVGLEAAHRHDVLHRDIKPGNLRETPDGRLKILDFGLAKMSRTLGDLSTTQSVTAGTVGGTVPYMPPEQLRGEQPDARSDVYAAGAVLYEMACGRRAFPQDSPPGLIGAILGQPPTSPRDVTPGVSTDLQRIILCCLEKDPSHRFRSAEELARALRGESTPGPERKPPAKRRRGVRARHVILGAAVAGTILAIAFGIGLFRPRLFDRPVEQSLAVLPLSNLSGDPAQEYFVDGITDELINRLAQVGTLRVISRSSVMQFKGTTKPLRDIARELRVGMVMEGSVSRSGEMVKVSAQLIDARKDKHIWAQSFERSIHDVFGLQSDIARRIVEGVRVSATRRERERLTAEPKVDAEAHKEYLKGRFAFNQVSGDAYRNAVEHFQRAIEIDPEFAQAYAGLADVYIQLSGNYLSTEEAMPRASAAATKSLQLDPDLASAHASLGYIKAFYRWEWTESETEFRRALEINPGEVTAVQNYGALLTALGRFEESSRMFERAREMDPLSPWVAGMSLWPLFEGKQFDRAASEARKLCDADPKVFLPRMILGQALVFRGEGAQAVAELERALALDSTNAFPLAYLGYAHAVSGDRARAQEILQRLQDRSKTSPLQPYVFMLIHIGLGEQEKALDLLEQAAKARSDELFFLKVDPALDPLRSEPRFKAVLAQMKFPA